MLVMHQRKSPKRIMLVIERADQNPPQKRNDLNWFANRSEATCFDAASDP
jgi:hypothetical protein